jgi:hypothetical protein
LEESKVAAGEEKLRRHKSNLLHHVTRINDSTMPKIMLNYGPSGRRRLGRPLKRLLNEPETGLLRANACGLLLLLLLLFKC